VSQGEVVRVFHNFVAAATTLVEHTRVLMRDKAIREEYDQKVCDSFAEDRSHRTCYG
jgi:hypothetical protein